MLNVTASYLRGFIPPRGWPCHAGIYQLLRNNMGFEKKSKDRLRRERRSKKREEKRWVRKGGEVVVRFVCPLCSGPHSRSEHRE